MTPRSSPPPGPAWPRWPHVLSSLLSPASTSEDLRVPQSIWGRHPPECMCLGRVVCVVVWVCLWVGRYACDGMCALNCVHMRLCACVCVRVHALI